MDGRRDGGSKGGRERITDGRRDENMENRGEK